MSNAYYPQQSGPYNQPPPPSYGQPQFAGQYNGPPPPSYGQPQFSGPYDQPSVVVQQPTQQPQVVVVEERRDPGCSGADCCCFALCAFCCGLCLSN
ncbi:hypothetical protein BLOT_009168 [Blomia tropicalis]|nr:hypothetical protein BLOT_009168 [Blomia tropicalis]